MRAEIKKHEMTSTMMKHVFGYIIKTIEIMKEYHHLVEHDNYNCYIDSSFNCFWRKYGASLVSIGILISIGVYKLKSRLDYMVLS